MSIAVIAGIVLLVALVSLPYTQEKAVLPLSAVHPFSLSVVDGIAYGSSPDGTVTALRVSDGSLLWHHTLPTDVPAPIQFTVVARVVYISLTGQSIDALSVSSGTLLWHRVVTS